MQDYEDPKWMKPFSTCMLLVAVYLISSVFFVLAGFNIGLAITEPNPLDLHGGRGIGVFFISIFVGVVVFGPLTTIGFAMYMAYKTRNPSKQKDKRKNHPITAL